MCLHLLENSKIYKIITSYIFHTYIHNALLVVLTLHKFFYILSSLESFLINMSIVLLCINMFDVFQIIQGNELLNIITIH